MNNNSPPENTFEEITSKNTMFSPLTHKVFFVLWLAGLISNIGTWLFNVTAGWLMTELSPSPLMVSLVQAATAMPIFLFALPAGALGDIFDRRKLLIYGQVALTLVLFIFAGLLHLNIINAWLLLLFTFLTGVGTAFFTPTWQAVIPHLVSRQDLPSAIALGGVSANIARAIGPAIGGFIFVAFGAILAVVLDAISYLFVVLALLWWQTTTIESALPRERLFGAMKAGIRFALLSEAMMATLVRSFAFAFFAAANWALLPLIAKDLLLGGPKLYGILLSGIGIGAVMGAFLLPFLKKSFNLDALVVIGTILTALSLLLFTFVPVTFTGILASLMIGVAWILVLSSLNISAQTAVPDWVRARGIAIFQTVFFGTMTLGSILWGHLAGMIGLKSSLTICAGLSLLVIPFIKSWKLNLGEFHDFRPSHHWPELELSSPIEPHRGPVLIMIEYLIAEENCALFEKQIKELGKIRKRDGAVFWGIFEDIASKGRYIETFVDESWVHHLRKHERVSHADLKVQQQLLALHIGSESPKVTHAVAPPR